MKADDKLSRAQFLRKGLRLALERLDESVRTAAKKVTAPMLRPPGALDDAEFLLRCARCGTCASACPHDSIETAGPEYGVAAGTPLVVPADTPCARCEDFPCIGACPEGALSASGEMRPGLAAVAESHCLACTGQVCEHYCFSRCPSRGKAISVADGRPIVDSAECTGCGRCEYICPAPGKGIRVRPRTERREPR